MHFWDGIAIKEGRGVVVYEIRCYLEDTSPYCGKLERRDMIQRGRR